MSDQAADTIDRLTRELAEARETCKKLRARVDELTTLDVIKLRQQLSEMTELLQRVEADRDASDACMRQYNRMYGQALAERDEARRSLEQCETVCQRYREAFDRVKTERDRALAQQGEGR